MKIEKMREIMNPEQHIDIEEIEKQLTPIGYNDERDVFEMGEWAIQYGQLLIDYIRKMDTQLDKLNKVAEAAKAYKDYDGKKEYLELADALDELERE